MRQAAHEWRILLNSTLKGFGFTQLKTDACVYHLTIANQPISGTLILGVFVDDILCLGTNSSIIQWFQSILSNQFSIIIKSDVESFLGMDVTRNRSINNQSYPRTISLSG